MRGKNIQRSGGNTSALKIIIVVFASIVVVAISVAYILNKDRIIPAASVQTPAIRQTGYENITSRELSDMLTAKNFTMINVHIPYEGEIAGTDVFIPYDKIKENPGKLPADKDYKLVIYCRTGRMSKIAAEELARLGYSNLYNLSDGMDGWEKQGFQLIKR